MDIFKDKYGYNRIIWDICEGYLLWDTFSNHILIIQRYPIISLHILSYPFISFNILKYPRGRTPRCQDVEDVAVPYRLHDDRVREHAAGECLVLREPVDLAEEGLDLRGTTAVRVQAEHARHRVVLLGPRGLNEPALEGYLQDMVVREGRLVVPVRERRFEKLVVLREDRDRLGLDVRDVCGHAVGWACLRFALPAHSSRFSWWVGI